jgi:hypothetical protein
MRNLALITLLLMLTILVSCNRSAKRVFNDVDFDLLSFLKDSTTILSNITDTVINGKLKGNSVNAYFHSISDEEFFAAINRNKNHIRYFNRSIKLNEFTENGIIYRTDSILKIEGEYDNMCLVDADKNENHRDVRFFLEGRVGAYYIIKRIQFEDAETVFWNSKTGKEDLNLFGLSVCSNPKDSLVFYSNTFKVVPEEKTSVCLMKIHYGRIDTLLHADTDWFTSFSFFDKKDSSIYYIHRFYDENNLKSIYAKMNLTTE